MPTIDPPINPVLRSDCLTPSKISTSLEIDNLEHTKQEITNSYKKKNTNLRSSAVQPWPTSGAQIWDLLYKRNHTGITRELTISLSHRLSHLVSHPFQTTTSYEIDSLEHARQKITNTYKKKSTKFTWFGHPTSAYVQERKYEIYYERGIIQGLQKNHLSFFLTVSLI